MKRLFSTALVALAACQWDVTPDEKRWTSLNGEEVYVVAGHSQVVHGNKACPEVANPKGDVRKLRVKGARLVDENGIYFGSEREKLPLCSSCVK